MNNKKESFDFSDDEDEDIRCPSPINTTHTTETEIENGTESVTINETVTMDEIITITTTKTIKNGPPRQTITKVETSTLTGSTSSSGTEITTETEIFAGRMMVMKQSIAGATTGVSSHVPVTTKHLQIETEDEENEHDATTTTTTQDLTIGSSAPIEPFGIVLVNIKKAAEEHFIHCENKVLDSHVIPYIALSYRWGELDEQMVAATNDYHARIVSFRLDDFFKLCQQLQHEPEMQHIEYVWVDAICVDQENVENRKATIYRMSDIYLQATAIIAVPDLHAYHLSSTTSANYNAMVIIEKYRQYLYYLLIDNTTESKQALIDMDHAWMDTLGISTLTSERLETIQAILDQQETTDNNNNDDDFLSQQMKSFTLDNNDDYQQLSRRMMMTFQQHIFAKRQTEIKQSMQFLQSLMEDWSNRAWVISEYHIAKKSKGKIKFWYNQLSSPELYGHRFFEFDFKRQPHISKDLYKTTIDMVPSNAWLSNNETWRQRFGEQNQRRREQFWKQLREKHRQQLEKDNDDEDDDTLLEQHPYTAQIIRSTRPFKTSMRRHLTRRTVLEMMLQTRASKNDDRFIAIFPFSSKYKHLIKDRHTTSQLNVSDMLSVRLQLLEWMDLDDQLNLLYSAPPPRQHWHLPLLPTFATRLKTIKPGLLRLISHDYDLNFDKKQADVVYLDRAQNPSVLLLCPRTYLLQETTTQDDDVYDRLGGKSIKLWQQIGLDPTVDTLVTISIPLFNNGNDTDQLDNINDDRDTDEFSADGLLRSNIQLVGSLKKNVWIRYQFCSRYKNHKIYPSRICNMDDHSKGFRIY